MTTRRPKKATKPPIEIVRKDGSIAHSHGDKRGYSRPPFQPGHTLSLVHGANSERAIATRAKQVHEELLTVAPYLDEDKFIPAVKRYLAAAAREALLDDYIRTVSAEKGPGAVSSRTWEQATAAARLAGKVASDLGLDPLGHARIRALTAGAANSEATLADLAAEGRAVRQRRQAELEGNDEPDTEDLEDTDA